jgi:hypothetical protein
MTQASRLTSVGLARPPAIAAYHDHESYHICARNRCLSGCAQRSLSVLVAPKTLRFAPGDKEHGLRGCRISTVDHGSLLSQRTSRRRESAGRKIKNPTRGVSGVCAKTSSLTLLTREGVYVQAMQAGLLTDGSSYSPTPSQHVTRQWLNLLAFVPDYSGAPARELHPLPGSATGIALN